jgi:hypothetical protein
MPQVDLFGDNNIPKGTELFDKRLGKIQTELHNYLRQGLVPGAVQQVIDKLDNISIDADSVNLNTDQLEAKLDTLNGLLTTVQTDLALVKTSLQKSGPITNRSLTVSTSVVQLAPANASRKYLFIQNNTAVTAASEETYVYVGIGYAPNSTNSIVLGPGASFVFEGTFVPTSEISVLGNLANIPVLSFEG